MHLPRRTYSENRNIPEKVHPTALSPAHWLGNCTISFDYFVDWSKNPPRLQNELWVKLLLDPEDPAPDRMDVNALMGSIRRCYPDLEKHRTFISGMREKMALELHFFLFDDRQDWENDDSAVFDVSQNGDTWEVRRLCLRELKDRIVRLTGERRGIGAKGLTLSTSELEYALSKTDSLWPGDVDGIILNRNNGLPMAVMEYRKHTMRSGLTSMKPYYDNGSDKRKYDRLFVLAEALELPLIVLTFPTREHLTQVQLELICIIGGALEVIETKHCPLPMDHAGINTLKTSILELMEAWDALP